MNSDWKNSAKHAYGDQSVTYWVWQFLRRGPEYRKVWEQCWLNGHAADFERYKWRCSKIRLTELTDHEAPQFVEPEIKSIEGLEQLEMGTP